MLDLTAGKIDLKSTRGVEEVMIRAVAATASQRVA